MSYLQKFILLKSVEYLKSYRYLTLFYKGGGGGGQICPQGSFFATVQKRLVLDCRNFVTFIISLLHVIWYTFWSPETQADAMATRFLRRVWLKMTKI